MSRSFPRPTRPLGDGVVALRAWRDGDLPALVEALQDPEVPRWTRVPHPYTQAHGREFLARSDHPEMAFAIVDARDDARLLGGLGVRQVAGDYVQLGYWVAAPARGRGVAVRAVELAAGWATGELGVRRVEILVQPENRRSQRVAEKAGFRREGVRRDAIEVKGRLLDAVVFSWEPAD